MLLNLNLNDVQEQSAAPIGTYELQVTGAQLVETGEKSKRPGSPMIKATLGFTNLELNAPNITHFITLPYEDDENASFKALMLKRFLVAFNIPFGDEVELEDLAYNMIGHTAMIDVGLTEPRDDGAVFNTIRIPRIANEAPSEGRGKAPGRKRG